MQQKDDPYSSLGAPVTAAPVPAPAPAQTDAPMADAPAPAEAPGGGDPAQTQTPTDAYSQVGSDAGASHLDETTMRDILAQANSLLKAGDEQGAIKILGDNGLHIAPGELEAFHKGQRSAGFNHDGVSPAEDPSIGKQLVDATANDVAGIAQGAVALPDMAAEGVGKVLSAVPNLISQALDAAGHTDAAKWVQDNITHNLANPAQVGDIIEGVSPTSDAPGGQTARVVGQLAGGAVGMPQAAVENLVTKLVGEAPEVAAVAKETAPGIVDAGKDAGIRVLTSDAKQPRTFVGKTAQAIGEHIPVAGTGGVREAQQAERIAAVKNLAQDYGATADEMSHPIINDVAKDLADTRSALLTKLTAQKSAVINKLAGAVPVPRAIKAINDQIANLTGINADAYAPVVAKLKGFRDQIASGKTLSQIEGNRKLLGDMFSDPSLASIKTDGQKAVNAIYAPLRDDMGAFIKANGNASDFSRWKGANDGLAGLAGNLKNTALKRALSTAETTPENVSRLLFSARPSDVRLLYDNLSETGRAKAQSAIIQRMVEKAGGLDTVSPDRFATQIGKLGNQTGVFFSGKDLARVSGLGRVLSATQRASQAAVAPATGVRAVPYALAAGFTHLFGIVGGISAAAGTGLLARAYESAPVRDVLLKLGRTKPGGSQERLLIERATAAINAAVQKHVPEALNDNTLASAAAQPQGDDQNQ